MPPHTPKPAPACPSTVELRGEDVGRSDIDLLIELPDGASAGGELLTVLGLSEELSEFLGVRVDVATARTLRSDVRERALAEAVPL